MIFIHTKIIAFHFQLFICFNSNLNLQLESSVESSGIMSSIEFVLFNYDIEMENSAFNSNNGRKIKSNPLDQFQR